MNEEQPEKVRSGWARALEIIKLTRLRSGKKQPKIEDEDETSDLSSDSHDHGVDSFHLLSFQHSDLMFPPKQQVLAKLTELITQMNHPENGLTTFEQDFSEVFSGESFQDGNCPDLNGEFGLETDGAFSTAELIDWLMQHLEMTSEKEASHLGAMLCRVGFIFPCNQPWDLCELNLDKEDSTIWRFQCPYYWPAENHIASETDHARHLLRRQANCYGIPFEDYEEEYLSKLESVFNQLKWELLKKTAGLNIGASEAYASILPQMLIASWQDYAYWKVNRPPCVCENVSSTNAYEWAIALRGLNRNFPYDSVEDCLLDGQCTEEHNEEDGKAAANDARTSCNRIVAFCKRMQDIDPFIDEDQANTNAWTNELIVLSDDSLTPARCRRWELSFDVLLKDPRGRSLFEEHLNREFSIENFEFYTKCITMKNAPVSQVEELAQEIFENYISRDGLTSINIDEEPLSYATTEFEEGRFRFAFDPALRDIYSLMKGDSYKRFLTTLPFQEKDIEKDVVEAAEEEEVEEDIDEGVEEDIEEDAEEDADDEAEEDAEEEADEEAEEDVEEEDAEEEEEEEAEEEANEDCDEYADEDMDEEVEVEEED